MLGILRGQSMRWRFTALGWGLLMTMGCSQSSPGTPDQPLADMAMPDAAVPPLDAAVPPIDASRPLSCPFPNVRSPGVPPVPTTFPDRLWSSGRNDVWLIGRDGKAAHFDGTTLKPVTDLPNPNLKLVGLSGNGAKDVWVSTADNLLLHYDGTAWSWLSPRRALAPFGELWAPRNDRVWTLVGSDLLRWDGTNFSTEPSGTTQTLYALWGILAGDGTAQIWAVGEGGTIVSGKSPGGTFAPMPSPPTTQKLKAIWGSGPNDIWVGAEASTPAAIYHWDGTSWSSSTLPSRYRIGSLDVHSIWGSGPNDVWASGVLSRPVPNALLHWDGTVWKEVSLAPTMWPNLVTGSGSGEVWAVGQQWRQSEPNQSPGISYLYRGDASGLQLVAGATAGAVLGRGPDAFLSLGSPINMRWDGTAWSPTSLQRAATDTQLVQFSPSDAWYADGETVQHWDGTQWTAVDPKSSYAERRIGTNSSGELWIWNGAEFTHWDGTTFVVDACPLPRDPKSYQWYSLFSGGAGDVWVLGNDPSIKGEASVALHRTPTGCTLAAAPPGFFRATASWAASPHDAWAVGRGGQTAHFDGTAWTVVDAGLSTQSFSGLWGLSSSDVWAAAGSDIVHWDGRAWVRGNCGEPIVHIGSTPGGYWALTSTNRILTE